MPYFLRLSPLLLACRVCALAMNALGMVAICFVGVC